MSNITCLVRWLAVAGALFFVGCTTKAFNTRAIGVSADGGARAGVEPPTGMTGYGPGPTTGKDPDPEEPPACPSEAPLSPRAVGQACACDIECATGTCQGRICCSGSACTPVSPLGASCEDDSECLSGFCADGVCCNVACTGACVSCNQPEQSGECVPVPAGGEDAHDVCRRDSPETCGQSGYCNGRGGCAKYSAGTTCRFSSCGGREKFVPASLCDGEGTCVRGVEVSCFPSTCVGGACLSSCVDSTECMAPSSCQAGSCGPKGIGQDCTDDNQCASTTCVDGVCCESACTGKCLFCANPDARGQCVPVRANTLDQRAARGETDPDKICLDEGASTCGTDGRCDGNGACQRYQDDTVCAGARCDAATNTETRASVCQDGTCVTPLPLTCAPYVGCMGKACRGVCASDVQCVDPDVCLAGDCGRKPTGAICSRAVECLSNICAQGRCCGTACAGTCKSCAVEGAVGICVNVPRGGPDPAGVCMDDACNNQCDGNGGCRREPVNTPCGLAPFCAGTTRTFQQCSAAGVCETRNELCAGATPLCTLERCAPPEKLPPGGRCLQDGECQPGLRCVDNRCCSGCNDACRTCNQTSGFACTVDRPCPPGTRCIDGSGVCTGCSGGQTLCGRECRNLDGDRNNCGGCGNACNGGSACCAGRCVNPQGDDESNCGGCNVFCSGECVDGICKGAPGDVCGGNLDCASGQCKGHCCDTGLDCAGACRVCGARTGDCEDASTATTCNDGRICTTADRCDGAGSCGGTVSCDRPPTCFSAPGVCGNGGQCVYENASTPDSSCGNDQSCCDGICCPPGNVCRSFGGNRACAPIVLTCATCPPCKACDTSTGSCTLDVNPGTGCNLNARQGSCDGEGTCVVPECSGDDRRCLDGVRQICSSGRFTDTPCPDGLTCQGGDCTLVCPDPLIECAGRCIDPRGDRSNCDTCGNVCPTGASCNDRSCSCPEAAPFNCGGECKACCESCGECQSCAADGNGCVENPIRDSMSCGGGGRLCCGGTCCGTGQVCRAGCEDPPPACDPACELNPCKVCQADGRCGDRIGTSCDDGNGCTRRDICQDGSCRGLEPVTCEASDECHAAGVCDAATGRCSSPTQADDSACSDQNPCTVGDSCQSGACQGGGQKACPDPDQCHERGVCNPDDGSCSNPARADETPCSDDNSCTAGDICQAGTCRGQLIICQAPEMCLAGACTVSCQAPRVQCGPECIDPTSDRNNCGACGNVCPAGGSCNDGVCACPGSAPFNCGGTCRDCCESCGECLRCAEDGNSCVPNPVRDSMSCGGGGSSCCAGTCCAASQTCGGQPGEGGRRCENPPPVCDPACGALNPCEECKSDGNCGPKAGGCNDGNACTQRDICQGGACVGEEPITCRPLDQCHAAGVCDPSTGVCSNPPQDDIGCSDQNPCTVGDTCRGGACLGGPPLVCQPPAVCLGGVCTVVCEAPRLQCGADCIDPESSSTHCGGCNNACPEGGACASGRCSCPDPARFDCDGACKACCSQCGECQSCAGDGKSCVANPGRDNVSCGGEGGLCCAGTCCGAGQTCGRDGCQNPPPVCPMNCGVTNPCEECKPDGSCGPRTGACNDGDACTQVDSCQGGRCVAGPPTVCQPSADCPESGVCDPGSGVCSNPCAADAGR
jgi:hypothetical protein